MKRILAILVEDRPGVLTRVSGLFSRRGYNIQNIAVGRTMEPGVSRMTVTVDADPLTVEQIVKQLNKLIDVLKVSDLTDEPAVREGADAGQSKSGARQARRDSTDGRHLSG